MKFQKENMIKYKIKPCAKPRMTQADKWKHRPTVMKYWAFKDRVKQLNIKLPVCDSHVTFYVAMPESWSDKKKAEMYLKPHQSNTDVDNFLKALMDGVYGNDSCVWDVRITKIWDYEGSIIIK